MFAILIITAYLLGMIALSFYTVPMIRSACREVTSGGWRAWLLSPIYFVPVFVLHVAWPIYLLVCMYFVIDKIVRRSHVR